MQHLVSWIGDFLPFLLLAALLGAIVYALNRFGRHLERHDAWLLAIDARVERHDAWLEAIDARVGGLQKDRAATWARRLQRPFELDVTEKAPLVPPPLPPRMPTLNALDWRDDDAATEDLLTRQTGRYPDNTPPKGPNDDDTTT